jgi:lysophospholipase L1-like esterase
LTISPTSAYQPRLAPSAHERKQDSMAVDYKEIRVRRDTLANFVAAGYVPDNGEPIGLIGSDGKATAYLIGDGTSTVNQLPALSKGDKGDPGQQGAPGTNTASNDAQNAALINDSTSATRGALDGRYNTGIALGAIMVMGDSITRGLEGVTTYAKSLCPRIEYWVEQFLTGLDVTIANEGISGQFSYQFLQRIPAALAADRPRFAVLNGSTNDLQASNTVSTPASVLNMRKQVAWARFHGAIPIIATTGPIDYVKWNAMRGQEYTAASAAKALVNNQALRDLAAELKVPLADVEKSFQGVTDGLYDGIHPNDSGADRWAQVIARTIAAQEFVYVGQKAVTDNFQRADSATSIGSATTGQAWVPVRGTWGISSNKGYSVTGADDDLLLIDSARADQKVTATFGSINANQWGMGVVVRSDATGANCYLATVAHSTGKIDVYEKLNGGGYSPIGTVTLGQLTSDTVVVSVIGSTIKVVANGATVLTVTDTSIADLTYVGFRHATAAWSRIVSFSVETATS